MIKTISNYRRKIARLLVAGAMLLPGASYAQNPSGSAELFSDGKTTTTDTKILIPSLTPSNSLLKKMGIFLRNRETIDHRVENVPVSSFSYADVIYNIKGGFDAIYEHELLPNGESVPMIGAKYSRRFGKNNDVTLYGLGVASLRDDEKVKRFAVIIGNIAYTPKLTESLNLVNQLEAVNNLGSDGINYAIQRARIGIKHKNGWAGGIGADIKEIPSKTGDPVIDKIIGVWVKKTF